eukprot:3653944-Prymnesium_polylepis.1
MACAGIVRTTTSCKTRVVTPCGGAVDGCAPVGPCERPPGDHSGYASPVDSRMNKKTYFVSSPTTTWQAR